MISNQTLDYKQNHKSCFVFIFCIHDYTFYEFF